MVLILSAIGITVLLMFIFWVRGIPSFHYLATIKKNILFVAIAQALILALQTGRILWSVFGSVPQQYNDFVAGSIGYSNATKTIEFPTRESARLVGETHFKAIPTGWAIIKYMLREIRNPD